MKKTTKRTRENQLSRIRSARTWLYLNIALWVLNGTLTIADMLSDQNIFPATLVSFFFLFALATLFIIVKIADHPKRWVYVTAITLIVLNIFLTLTGYPDFLFIFSTLIDLFILGNLISLKSYYDK
ncbi:MAG: hypothetical protein OHK003_24380 [Anaerolineales bacterium]